MNAIYLHRPDGTQTGWSMCTECNTVACPGNYDLSQKCCICYDCGEPLPKDERIPYAEGKSKALYHRVCERKRRDKIEAEHLEKAELIEGYGGPVYYEGVTGSYGDGYFENVEELAEHFDSDSEQSNRPEFAFCCKEQSFRGADAQSIIESACEEMDEDADDRIEGREELEKACAAFNEANKELVSWYQDRKRKVAVPKVGTP